MPTPLYNFQAGGVMRASEFNANFALLEQCLGLGGGTLTGTLNSRDIFPSTHNTYALGSISKAFASVVAVALKLTDSDASHLLSLVTGSNLTANRTLTFNPGDASRTVTIAADCTIGGVAPISLGGTGLSTTPTNGQLLIGNGTGFTLAELTAGSNITITPGAGSIQIAAASATDTTPVGAGYLWFTDTEPSADYVFCRGQAISRTTYAALFNLIGETFGAGNGTTTFNVPDLQQRFPLGKAASGTGDTLAGTGGNIDHSHTAQSGGAHTHTVANVTVSTTGAHTHTFSATTSEDGDHTHEVTSVVQNTHPGGGGGDYVESVGAATGTDGAHTHSVSGTTSNDGNHTHSLGGNVDSDGAHTHTTTTANPPFLVVNFVVRAK